MTAASQWSQTYVGRLKNTQEESSEQETGETARESRANGQDSPDDHDTAHEGRRRNPSHEHVGGDTKEDVADKKNRHAGLVLHIRDSEVLFEGRHCSV